MESWSDRKLPSCIIQHQTIELWTLRVFKFFKWSVTMNISFQPHPKTAVRNLLSHWPWLKYAQFSRRVFDLRSRINVTSKQTCSFFFSLRSTWRATHFASLSSSQKSVRGRFFIYCTLLCIFGIMFSTNENRSREITFVLPAAHERRSS